MIATPAACGASRALRDGLEVAQIAQEADWEAMEAGRLATVAMATCRLCITLDKDGGVDTAPLVNKLIDESCREMSTKPEVSVFLAAAHSVLHPAFQCARKIGRLSVTRA